MNKRLMQIRNSIRSRIRSRLHRLTASQHVIKMSFFDKIKDVTYVNSFKQFIHTGSNVTLVASRDVRKTEIRFGFGF